jgi:transposase
MKPSESNHKFCLGIDISKADFHVAIQCQESAKIVARGKFANTPEGHTKLHVWLVTHCGADLPIHACMEATGSYGEMLADFLHGKVAKLSVVNPRAIKAHGDSELRRCKSDPADARLIADFCRVKKPTEWNPPSQDQRRIKSISRHISDLKKDITRESNRLEITTEKSVMKSLKSHITWMKKQIEKLEKELEDAIMSNEERGRDHKLLLSIPGIGAKSAANLIAELPDIKLLKNARQLAAYAGTTPRIFQTGTSGKTRTPMSKAGNCHLRKILFFPAMAAIRFNPICKNFAARLAAKGKPPIVIIGAVMTKLLHIIYGVLKYAQPFNPNHLQKAQIIP